MLPLTIDIGGTRLMRRRLIPLLAFTAATLGTVFVGPAHAETTTISTVMTGAQEAPLHGDPDAIGSALITLNSDTGQVCVRFHIQRVDPLTAAHIHVGPRGVAGPVVIPLPAPADGSGTGCVTASTALVQRIIDNPAAYYVNVHNAPYPGGAARGQLA
jgi:CHRD domain-containing protein